MNNVLSIEELFAGRVFRVPDYQRGYAWETRQVDDFIEDLELLDVHREHYTGTIVLRAQGSTRRVDTEGKSSLGYDIVDGQQRLATVTVVLDCIRREMEESEQIEGMLPSGIRRTYIQATEINGLPLYKLALNSDSDHFFREVILSDTPTPEGPQISSEKRLAEAQGRFRKYLASQKEKQGSGYAQWLTELYLKVATRLRLTLYEVESEAEVGTIFELMNNRGKPLSELEKVKNYLLYAGSTAPGPHDLAKIVNAAWSEILRQLMSADLTRADDENELLRAHWLAWYDPRPRVFDGSRSIKDHFDVRRYVTNKEELLVDLSRYAESLRATAVCVCDARAPERQDAFQSYPEGARDSVKLWSAKLTRAEVLASFLPLLIATRIRFPGDADHYEQVVRLCERFAMRVYRLGGKRTDAGQKELVPLGYNLNTGLIFWKTLRSDLLLAILAYSPPASFRKELEAEQNWYEWAGLKYFLYEYEEYLAKLKGATPKVSWEEVRRRERADTIEHILPQDASDPYWSQRFTEEERRRLTHDLGNLTLTKDNASYSNRPFPQKRAGIGPGKPSYAESPFYMERELARHQDWTPQEIVERRQRLTKWALERWGLGPLDEPEPIPVPSDTEQ
jgi:hypothetical protein